MNEHINHPHRCTLSIFFATLLLCCLATGLVTAQPLRPQAQHGTTEEGSPWIGASAETARLTIVEYGDYLCGQCAQMHNHLRQLVKQYPDQIRLIHHQFPLDSAVNPIIRENIHKNSGLLSLFAIMAQEQNLFWPVSDALFREARFKQSIDFSAIAQETGMDISNFQDRLNTQKFHQHLADDIRSALRYKITATPSYVVDGKVYVGEIPLEILESALKTRLAR